MKTLKQIQKTLTPIKEHATMFCFLLKLAVYLANNNKNPISLSIGRWTSNLFLTEQIL